MSNEMKKIELDIYVLLYIRRTGETENSLVIDDMFLNNKYFDIEKYNYPHGNCFKLVSKNKDIEIVSLDDRCGSFITLPYNLTKNKFITLDYKIRKIELIGLIRQQYKKGIKCLFEFNFININPDIINEEYATIVKHQNIIDKNYNNLNKVYQDHETRFRNFVKEQKEINNKDFMEFLQN